MPRARSCERSLAVRSVARIVRSLCQHARPWRSYTLTQSGEQAAEAPARGPRAQLVLTASLTLFVELALIRWLGANVLYLAYFSNVVLLGSFLGIGAGFLWASRRPPGRCSSSPRRRSPPSSC